MSDTAPTIFTDKQVLDARYYADQLQENLLVRFWLCESGAREETIAYHEREAIEAFQRIASALGYDILSLRKKEAA